MSYGRRVVGRSAITEQPLAVLTLFPWDLVRVVQALKETFLCARDDDVHGVSHLDEWEFSRTIGDGLHERRMTFYVAEIRNEAERSADIVKPPVCETHSSVRKPRTKHAPCERVRVREPLHEPQWRKTRLPPFTVQAENRRTVLVQPQLVAMVRRPESQPGRPAGG